jgi:hypothetical protein
MTLNVKPKDRCMWDAAALGEIMLRPDPCEGRIPEMNQPSYWISRMSNPDQVILSPAAIREKNEAYRAWMASPTGSKVSIPTVCLSKPTLTGGSGDSLSCLMSMP